MLRATSQDQESVRPQLVLAAVLCAVALAYANALPLPFAWDDHELIAHNPAVAGLASIPDLFAGNVWSNPSNPRVGAYYRPLTLSSFAIDRALWGSSPAGFHGTNLILHLGVCALVFALARRLGAGALAAGLAALLFGTFPRLTESVTWISGRTDILAALGALAAIALYAREPRSPAWRWCAGLALFAGLLSKEVAFAGAAALLVFEWQQPRGQRRWRHLAPIALACAGYLALRARVELQLSGMEFTAPERIAFALQAVGEYARMLGTPWSPQIFSVGLGVYKLGLLCLGAGAVAALAVGGWRWARSRPDPRRAALVALALFSIAPVLHLVAVPQPALAADRFLYLPLAGLFALLGAAVPVSARLRPIHLAPLALGLALSFGWATAIRNLDWADERRLWEVTVAGARDGLGYPEIELAAVLARRGHVDEAAELYERAFEIQTRTADRIPAFRVATGLKSNFGMLLSEQGEFDRALPLLEEVVRANPDAPVDRLHYGIALARALEFERAERALGEALALHPDYAMALTILRQTREARTLWSRLPPVEADEPTVVVAARAWVHHLLGRVPHANRLWIRVLEAPELTPSLLARARRTLAQQQSVLPDSPHVLALERALIRRLEAAHPARGAVSLADEAS